MPRTSFLILLLVGSSSLTKALSAERPDDLAQRYTVTAKDVKVLRSAQAGERLDDGRVILGGGAILPTTDEWQGVDWLACAGSDGHILWSARAEPQFDHASLFPLTTDGNSIWQTGVRKNGSFEVARFE